MRCWRCRTCSPISPNNAPELQPGREGGDDPGCWRDLHPWGGEIAIHSGDPGAIRRAFDEFLLYLPQQAREFFVDCMKKAKDGDYPPLARKMAADYLGRASVALTWSAVSHSIDTR